MQMECRMSEQTSSKSVNVNQFDEQNTSLALSAVNILFNPQHGFPVTINQQSLPFNNVIFLINPGLIWLPGKSP